MARAPPSQYNKLFGKPHGKSPASVKTLTTNTHTTTTGVSSVIHDPSVPRTYLFDIYKNEAESHFEIGEYRQAADCYNAAVKLQPNDTAAIIARSRCYAQMGRWKRAMKDCDAALSIDAAYAEALYQKAEILYVNGNLDLSLVYFKRALKQNPDSIRFKNGVQKVSEAIQKQSGVAAHKASKLTAVGDLSMFLHSKAKPRRAGQPKETPRLDDEDSKLELPSAGFRARFNVAPLIRINRKPGVSILRTYRSESAKSNSSAGSANRDPDEATMRTILGELYGDRKYLKKFQNNLPGGKAERDLTLLADEGLEFLRERTVFWDSLGPLPPPQVPKRSNMRERSFFMTNNDNSPDRKANASRPKMERSKTDIYLPPLPEHRNNNNNNNGNENNIAEKPQGETAAGKKKLGLTPRKARKKKKPEVAMGLERDYSDVDFKFRSLQPSRSASRLDEACPDSLPTLRDMGRSKTRAGRTMFVGFDDPDRDRKRQLTKFINKEMDVIDEAFKTGEFEDCRNKANICLMTVTSLPGDDINKNEVVASLHSCIGNACIAMNDFEGALKHHMEALSIGENENLIEVVNRSLGHLGRMYIIQKRFNKALEVFARKAPTVVSAEEVAQVFHEIGNCFLALGHLDYARDCGKKALRAALEADIHYFKFQSWVLIAVSESRMKHHDEAYKAFDAALNLAKEKDDEESVNVILFAMEHLSKTITSIMRKRTMLNERLTSRSRTQTILDLNKRPHAAKMKKRKKKLRREGTDLDDAALTRQGTYVLIDEPEGKAHKVQDNETLVKREVTFKDTGDTSPRLDYTRGSTMFEKSPRELEPFGDPDVINKKKQEKLAAVRVHSRHGALDRLGSGSRRGSWASMDEPTSRRESQEETRLEIPPSPNHIGSAMKDSGSAHRKASPENEEERQMRPPSTRLSPLKRRESGGALSDANTPRVDLSHEEISARGDHRHMTSIESISYEDGFLSQREEYYSKSRTGGHHAHRGGYHSNRESRAESNEDHKHHGKITPREGTDSTQQMAGAKSRSRNKRANLHDTSLEEQVGETEEADETGDVTGASNNWYGDLSSGRYGDLSVTLESNFRTTADEDLTPRGCNTTDNADSAKALAQQRNPNAMQAGTMDNSLYRKTPGRFTRESYFDENEGNAEMNQTDGGASPEHVSVSRQHTVARKMHGNNPVQKMNAAQVESPRTERDATKTNGNNGQFQMARSSSKVSLRAAKNEDTVVVTLETSKPYRVSSANSERNARSGQVTQRDGATHEDEEKKRGVEEESPPKEVRPDLRSPAKSQASALTTGSGWDGDVSTETDVMQADAKKEKSKKSKPGKNDETSTKVAQQNQDSLSQQNLIPENSENVQLQSSNDDVTISLPEGTTEDSTVTSLKPRDVQDEVMKNTEDVSTEEKRLLLSSKVAYLDQKHATKVWREARDLEDIQSVPYSSRAELMQNGKPESEAKNIPPESDADRSVTLPISLVSSNATAEQVSPRSRPADRAEDVQETDSK